MNLSILGDEHVERQALTYIAQNGHEIASIISRIIAVQPDRDALRDTAFLTREWL